MLFERGPHLQKLHGVVVIKLAELVSRLGGGKTGLVRQVVICDVDKAFKPGGLVRVGRFQQKVFQKQRCSAVCLRDDGDNVGMLVLLRVGEGVVCVVAHFVLGFIQQQVTKTRAAAVVVGQLIENVVDVFRF